MVAEELGKTHTADAPVAPGIGSIRCIGCLPAQRAHSRYRHEDIAAVGQKRIGRGRLYSVPAKSMLVGVQVKPG